MNEKKLYFDSFFLCHRFRHHQIENKNNNDNNNRNKKKSRANERWLCVICAADKGGRRQRTFN